MLFSSFSIGNRFRFFSLVANQGNYQFRCNFSFAWFSSVENKSLVENKSGIHQSICVFFHSGGMLLIKKYNMLKKFITPMVELFTKVENIYFYFFIIPSETVARL